jgi:DNA (cytosine-5)-methyltransferase 1
MFNELALFAGSGGGILGGKLLGWRTVCAVEIEDYPRRVLMQRQNDGIIEPFPIWDDVTTFDGKPWRGRVDVVSGGFPCQDISCAGKGTGIDGERSGLWSEMARIIGEVRPRFAFVENSPLLISRGLTTVLGDLAEMGYDARWGVIGANHIGGPQKRERVWLVANTKGQRLEKSEIFKRKLCKSSNKGVVWGFSTPICIDSLGYKGNGIPVDLRGDHDESTWVERVKALGNGQVSGVAALAWRILSEI